MEDSEGSSPDSGLIDDEASWDRVAEEATAAAEAARIAAAEAGGIAYSAGAPNKSPEGARGLEGNKSSPEGDARGHEGNKTLQPEGARATGGEPEIASLRQNMREVEMTAREMEMRIMKMRIQMEREDRQEEEEECMQRRQGVKWLQQEKWLQQQECLHQQQDQQQQQQQYQQQQHEPQQYHQQQQQQYQPQQYQQQHYQQQQYQQPHQAQQQQQSQQKQQQKIEAEVVFLAQGHQTLLQPRKKREEVGERVENHTRARQRPLPGETEQSAPPSPPTIADAGGNSPRARKSVPEGAPEQVNQLDRQEPRTAKGRRRARGRMATEAGPVWLAGVRCGGWPGGPGQSQPGRGTKRSRAGS